MTCPSTPKLPIADIIVGKRHRKDAGDIAGVAASIDELGLLQPIAVTPSGKLIAGWRRLQAVMSLGWEEVPVHFVEKVSDVVAQLKAELAENKCRKDMTPEEAVDLGKSIKDEVAERNRDAQADGGKIAGRSRPKIASPKLGEAISESDRHSRETAEQIAAAAGMGRETFRKAEAVVDAARAAPEEFQDILDRMNETGKVDPAFKELEKRQHPPEPEPKPAHPYSDWLWNMLDIISKETMLVEHPARDGGYGGIKGLLAEPEKWNWSRTRGVIIPVFEDLLTRLTRYFEAIDHASQNQEAVPACDQAEEGDEN